MRVIDNPVSGERIIIRRSGTDTGGTLLSFDLLLAPGTHVPARHAHPGQEESFTVITGTMYFRVGRRAFSAGPGETVCVPPGTSHWFGNRSDGNVHARVEARPALRLEELFAANEALMCRTVAGRRLPHLTAVAAVLLEFGPEIAPPHIPQWLFRAVLAAPAWIGRRHAQSHRVACAPPS